MYAGWLESNPGSPEAPIVFNQYFRQEGKLAPLLETAGKFLHSAPKGMYVSETLSRTARLFEVAGRPEDARDAYLAALATGWSGSSLESAFLLSLEMNDVEALRNALAMMKDSPKDTVDFLKACVALQTGDTGPASRELARIAETSADQSTVLRALWLTYQISVQAGDSSTRQDAARRIQARFPRSPESAIVFSAEKGSTPRTPATVTLLALPGSFLAGAPGAPLPETAGSAAAVPVNARPVAAVPPVPVAQPAPVAPAAPSPLSATQAAPAPPATDSGSKASTVSAQKTVSVQVGSFQMKENADDLVGELTRNGFSPFLRVDQQQGKSLYRVFVGSRLSVEDARRVLDRLHQAGFSGFLLSDQ